MKNVIILHSEGSDISGFIPVSRIVHPAGFIAFRDADGNVLARFEEFMASQALEVLDAASDEASLILERAKASVTPKLILSDMVGG